MYRSLWLVPEVIERDVSRPAVAQVLRRGAQRAERSAALAVDVLSGARADREKELDQDGTAGRHLRGERDSGSSKDNVA